MRSEYDLKSMRLLWTCDSNLVCVSAFKHTLVSTMRSKLLKLYITLNTHK